MKEKTTMAIPKLHPDELKSILAFCNESKECDFADIKPFLSNADPTLERFRNLIAPEIRKKGIKVDIKGNTITFQHKEITQEMKPQEEISNKTKLEHAYVAPKFYKDLLISVIMGDHPLFNGPKGCGKSLTAEYLGHEIGKKAFHRTDYRVTRISLGGYFNPSDLIGETLLFDAPSGNGTITKFVLGHLAEAVKYGYMLICDEVDCMSPEANSAFQRITETDGKVIIKTETGTLEIPKHPHYRLIFTSNTKMRGDSSGMFNGAQVQNSAFIDRIPITFEFDYMPEYEAIILKEQYKLPTVVCEMLYGSPAGTVQPTGLVPMLREACKNGTIQDQLSMRTIMEFARHYRAFKGGDVDKCHSWHKSMEYCFVSKFPEQYHNVVKNTIKDVCGAELIPTSDRKIIDSHTAYLKAKGFFPTEETYLPQELKMLSGNF